MQFTFVLLISLAAVSHAELDFGNIYAHINALGFDYTQIDYFEPSSRSKLYTRCLDRGGQEAANQLIRAKEAHLNCLTNIKLVREVMLEALEADFPMMIQQGAHKTACLMMIAFRKCASLISGPLSGCLSDEENAQKSLFEGLGTIFYHSQCVMPETKQHYEEFVERGGRVCLNTQAQYVNNCLNKHLGKYERQNQHDYVFFSSINTSHQEQCSDLRDFIDCTLDIARKTCPNAFKLFNTMFKHLVDVFLCNSNSECE